MVLQTNILYPILPIRVGYGHFHYMVILKGKKTLSLRPRKKKRNHVYTGGWTFQVGSVGQDILFKIFFFFLVAKMTPLKKTTKFPQSLSFFGEKNWKKIFSYFQKKFRQISNNGWFNIVLANYKKKNKKKKKIYQNGKSGLVPPVKQGFLFSRPNHIIAPIHCFCTPYYFLFILYS